MAYDKKTDTFTENFMNDFITPQKATEIPWINAPQINSSISIET